MASIIKSNTYADFNGREILTANNDGALTTQKTNYPAFFGTQSTATSMATGTFTKILIDTMTYNTDNAFDTSNNRFVVPSGKAGKYLFRSGIYTGATLNDSTATGVYYINGSIDNLSMVQQNITGGGGVVTNWSYIVDLSVGDYVEMYGKHLNGNTLTAQTAYTSFQGFRIGS